jgi:dimethylaniline monooxygenase (N-oxide forming)
VNKVRRQGSDAHVISFSKDGRDEEWECNAVAVCSGLHVEPDIPFLKGLENVPVVMHSSEFKGRNEFGEGKDVMILGAGETAMDLSYLAVTSPTKSVTMCHRDGFFYAPKVSHPSTMNEGY